MTAGGESAYLISPLTQEKQITLFQRQEQSRKKPVRHYKTQRAAHVTSKQTKLHRQQRKIKGKLKIKGCPYGRSISQAHRHTFMIATKTKVPPTKQKQMTCSSVGKQLEKENLPYEPRQ